MHTLYDKPEGELSNCIGYNATSGIRTFQSWCYRVYTENNALPVTGVNPLLCKKPQLEPEWEHLTQILEAKAQRDSAVAANRQRSQDRKNRLVEIETDMNLTPAATAPSSASDPLAISHPSAPMNHASDRSFALAPISTSSVVPATATATVGNSLLQPLIIDDHDYDDVMRERVDSRNSNIVTERERILLLEGVVHLLMLAIR